MVCDTKSDRPPCFVLRQDPSMPTPNCSIRREEPSITITADLRPFVTHTGLTINTALFLLVIVIVTHSSSMKGPRLNFHAEHELAHPKTTLFSFLQLQYRHVRRLYSRRAAVQKKSSHRRGCGFPRGTSPKL